MTENLINGFTLTFGLNNLLLMGVGMSMRNGLEEWEMSKDAQGKCGWYTEEFESGEIAELAVAAIEDYVAKN